MMEEINSQPQNPVSYTEENIRHLSDMEHESSTARPINSAGAMFRRVSLPVASSPYSMLAPMAKNSSVNASS